MNGPFSKRRGRGSPSRTARNSSRESGSFSTIRISCAAKGEAGRQAVAANRGAAARYADLIADVLTTRVDQASARLRYSFHLPSTHRWSWPNCSMLIFLNRPCLSTKWITGARVPFSARVLLRPVKRNFPFSIS